MGIFDFCIAATLQKTNQDYVKKIKTIQEIDMRSRYEAYKMASRFESMGVKGKVYKWVRLETLKPYGTKHVKPCNEEPGLRLIDSVKMCEPYEIHEAGDIMLRANDSVYFCVPVMCYASPGNAVGWLNHNLISRFDDLMKPEIVEVRNDHRLLKIIDCIPIPSHLTQFHFDSLLEPRDLIKENKLEMEWRGWCRSDYTNSNSSSIIEVSEFKELLNDSLKLKCLFIAIHRKSDEEQG